MRRIAFLITITSVGLVLAGCNDNSASDTAATHAEADWVLTSEPADAVSVTAAKLNSEQGALIAVRGRIGGRKSPLSPESPVFTIVDLAMPYCGEVEEDGCKTPWDYCCETPEDLRTNTATVQLVGENGQALNIDPTVNGLEPLDEVVVVGKVGARPTADILTIQATGVYTK